MTVAEWTVQLDPPAVATGREMLDLNSSLIRVDQAGIDWGQAEVTANMAAEQQWGSAPISYRVPNRLVTIPLFLGGDDGTFDDVEAAKTLLEQKVALLQRENGFLLRQRASGDPMYADIMNATLAIPDVWLETGGIENQVSLVLECLPDFYGDEIVLDTVSGAGALEAVLQHGGAQAVIRGDHPGRAQVALAEDTGHDQYGLLWGFRSRHYDSGNGLSLPVSGAGTGATDWVEIASYASGGHIGAYQVWTRVTGDAGAQVRAAWAIGDATHGLIGNPGVSLLGNESLISLGQVQLDRVPIGIQRWALSIQCRNGAASVLAVYLQPLDECAGSVAGRPAVSDPAVLANGYLELRYDGIFRSASTPDGYTPVGGAIGDLPRIPPSGAESRPVSFFARLSRGDLTAATVDSTAGDAFGVTVTYRPSFLFRP